MLLYFMCFWNCVVNHIQQFGNVLIDRLIQIIFNSFAIDYHLKSIDKYSCANIFINKNKLKLGGKIYVFKNRSPAKFKRNIYKCLLPNRKTIFAEFFFIEVEKYY